MISDYLSTLSPLMTPSPAAETSGENSDNHVQCYNKGCGKKFDPANNENDSCTYHPGPPYFHDAYKIWNCCQKKSTDFGTWLAYPGCTRGLHNPEKPTDIVKVAAVKEIRPEKEEDVIVWKGLNKPAERIAEESRNEEKLKVEVTAGAQTALEKYREMNSGVANEGGLRVGAPCKNMGCNKAFAGVDSDSEECVYHPGQAVFHEGMKYWSCCQKKTSNFGAFLEQKGCAKGSHVWRMNEKVDKVKEDWFSSSGNITVNIYCKGIDPETSSISSDGQMLRVSLKHGFGTKETDLVYDLWGRIVPGESVARVGERKVEIVLKQQDLTGWPRLVYDAEVDNANPVSA